MNSIPPSETNLSFLSRMFGLGNKTAIVTGAGRGIGRAVALGLARAGANVVAIDVNAEAVKGAGLEITKVSPKSLTLPADVTCEDDLREVNKRILNEFGRVDILCNIAGIQIVQSAEEIPISEWRKVVNVNLDGVFLSCQIFGCNMIAQKSGKIINMASIHGLLASGLHPAASYNASKAGVINLTRSLTSEWGKYNINVNALAPALVKTEITQKRLNDPVYYQKVMERIPLGRIVITDDVCAAVIFLASPASNMITGQTIVIDGGWISHS